MTLEETAEFHCRGCETVFNHIRYPHLIKGIDGLLLPPGEDPRLRGSLPTGEGKTRLRMEPDRSRWSFFRALRPAIELVGMPGTNYRAFLYPEGRGIFTSILEAPEDANATYIVRGSEDECRLLATMTKSDILREKPQGFVGRAFHTETWKERIRKYLPN